MNEIPFKQTETISNEYVLVLVFIVGVLAVAIVLVLKLLKQKGIVSFKEKTEGRVNIIEKKYLSASTQVYLVEVDGKQHLLTESSKNIEMTEILKSNCFDKQSVEIDSQKGTD